MKGFSFFNKLGTQWRLAEGRKVGLDYTAVDSYMRMCRIPEDERPELISDVQVMEFAVLDVWAQQ